MLNICESELFLGDLSSVCVAEWEAKEDISLDVKGQPLFFPGSLHRIEGFAGWPASPWALFVSQNSEWFPFWHSFRSGWAPLGGPGDRNFDAGPSRDPNFDPLSWLEPLSFGPKNIKV